MSALTPAQQALAAQFDRAVVLSIHLEEITGIAQRIIQYKPRYDAVVKRLPSIPWWVIGVLHSMECDLSFNKHLHNGDSLSARTKNDPAGRPPKGSAPFDWTDSAVDALKYDRFDAKTGWSIGETLDAIERYNGLGYRNHTPPVPSPYLWSFSNQYSGGKYVADRVYDPKAVSKQAGAATIIKALQNLGAVRF